MQIGDTEIKRININEDLWVAFQYDKLIFGGSFLPKSVHITTPYGFTTKYIDFHITRNLENTLQIHAPFVKIHQDDLVQILKIISIQFSRYILGYFKETTVDWLSSNNYIFLPSPAEGTKEHQKLVETMKSTFSPLLEKKGKLKNRYKITVDEKRINELLMTQWFNSVDPPLKEWFKSNLYYPLIINELEGCMGMVFSDSNWYGFVRLPYQNTYRNFMLSKDVLLTDTATVLKKIIGDKLDTKLINKWNQILERIQKMTDHNEFKNDRAIIIKPILKSNKDSGTEV